MGYYPGYIIIFYNRLLSWLYNNILQLAIILAGYIKIFYNRLLSWLNNNILQWATCSARVKLILKQADRNKRFCLVVCWLEGYIAVKLRK